MGATRRLARWQRGRRLRRASVGHLWWLGWLVTAQAEGSELPSAVPVEVHATVDRYVGAYAFAGGPAEREALLEAIDGVVAEMSFLIRSTARERLRAATPIPDIVRIERQGDALAIAFDERRYEAKLDGSATDVQGMTGDPLRYRVHVTSSTIRQVFAGPNGGRNNQFRRRGEMDVELDVVISSAHLPKPLKYRLTFRRL